MSNELIIKPITEMTISQREKVYSMRKEIDKFMDDIEASLIQDLENGVELEHYELQVVKGRRSWIPDVDKIVKALKKLKYNPYKESLVSFGEVEKELGARAIQDLLIEGEATKRLKVKKD